MQATETMVLGARGVNETRFQFMRTNIGMLGDNTVPALNVQGAFSNGGAQVGNSGAINHHWELSNTTTYTHERRTR